MSDTVIKVENIGKKYRIGALQKRHDTLRDRIADFFKPKPKSEIGNKKSEDEI